MNEWQDIADAPRDGTHILVFAKGKHGPAIKVAVCSHYYGWVTEPGRWVIGPTHWMPLPTPPIINSVEG